MGSEAQLHINTGTHTYSLTGPQCICTMHNTMQLLLKYKPHRTAAVFSFYSPPAIITAPCDAPFNIPLYQCAFCYVTAQAHRKSRVRSNNAPTGNFYVVYSAVFDTSSQRFDTAGPVSILWHICSRH